VDVIWILLSIAVLGGLAWLGYMVEPHWVAKNGQRFLCNAQLLDERGAVLTRWRETRIAVMPTGELLVDQKKLMRHRMSTWHMAAEAPDPPRNRTVFLLRGRDQFDRAAMMAIRLPAKSRAVAMLRPLVKPAADR
jgi:hypothetical protein